MRVFIMHLCFCFWFKSYDLQHITVPNDPYIWNSNDVWNDNLIVNASLWIVHGDIHHYDVRFQCEDAFEQMKPFNAAVYYNRINKFPLTFEVGFSSKYFQKVVSMTYKIFLHHKYSNYIGNGPIVKVNANDYRGPKINKIGPRRIVNGTKDIPLHVAWDFGKWTIYNEYDWFFRLDRLLKNPKTIKNFQELAYFSNYNFGVNDYAIRKKEKNQFSIFYYMHTIGYYIPSDELIDGAEYRITFKKYHGFEIHTQKVIFKQTGKEEYHSKGNNWKKVIGIFFAILFIIVLIALIIQQYRKKRISEQQNTDSTTTSDTSANSLAAGSQSNHRQYNANGNSNATNLPPTYQEALQNMEAPPPYPG